MDELISTHLRGALTAGSDTLIFLGVEKATGIKQITHGDRIPCQPIGIPFSNWSPEEIYEYWNTEIRPDPTTKESNGW